MILNGRRISYFQGEETCFFFVMTRVRFGHRISIPQKVCPCNSDYKDLCNDVYLCFLELLVRKANQEGGELVI